MTTPVEVLVAWNQRPTGPLSNLYLTSEQQEAVYQWLARIIADEREKAAQRVLAVEHWEMKVANHMAATGWEYGSMCWYYNAADAARGGGWARCGCGPTKCEMHAKARAEVARIYAERRDEQE